MPDPLPAAGDVFSAVPSPRGDGAALRARVRALRSADRRLIGVLDDDPTGSQSMHDVQVVTVPDEDACQSAFGGKAGTCFVLTNSRSLGEAAAARVTAGAGRALLAAADRCGGRAALVSRSDSTLRGHVLAEIDALAEVQREATGRGPDAILLVPAFIEAGRVTAGGVHWARAAGGLVPVGETEFARDPVFGYRASDLRDFLAEKSGGAIRRGQIASIGLTEVRQGGPGRIREILAGLRDGAWVVVDAVEYSDLEAVACGALEAERAGAALLFRSGPSFVRALSGLEPKAPLRGEAVRAAGAGAGCGHGLVVAGSYTAQTSRQLDCLRASGGIADVELDVRRILAGAADASRAAGAAARQVSAGLARSDVLLSTSRGYVAGEGGDRLADGRAISSALVNVVRHALGAEAARPGWIIAKGGITAHDIALRALGIRRAEVVGQLFPGLVSVFRPLDAAPEATGMPFVVFPGNVGGDQALAEAVAILRGEDPG